MPLDSWEELDAFYLELTSELEDLGFEGVWPGYATDKPDALATFITVQTPRDRFINFYFVATGQFEWDLFPNREMRKLALIRSGVLRDSDDTDISKHHRPPWVAEAISQLIKKEKF